MSLQPSAVHLHNQLDGTAVDPTFKDFVYQCVVSGWTLGDPCPRVVRLRRDGFPSDVIPSGYLIDGTEAYILHRVATGKQINTAARIAAMKGHAEKMRSQSAAASEPTEATRYALSVRSVLLLLLRR